MANPLKTIRLLTILFIIVLVISGLTAFPVYTELNLLINLKMFPEKSAMQQWLLKVWNGVKTTHEQFPFIFYGFDWLAFAHLIIALLFVGVYKHPVRNKWIVQWAIISCIGVLPLAIIAGSIRGIPFYHILIDCSFGVIGLIPLSIIQIKINQLQKLKKRPSD